MKKANESKQWAIIMILGAVVFVLATWITVLLLRPVKVVANFEQCKEAGGALMESYPEQCMINRVSFTNPDQSLDFDADKYVGMTEDDAMAEAKASNTPARVVERDGEGLPTTMDFIFGRHNFYIKDGKIYKVEVEGQAVDGQE